MTQRTTPITHHCAHLDGQIVDLGALTRLLDAVTDHLIAHLAVNARAWTASPAERHIIACLAADAAR